MSWRVVVVSSNAKVDYKMDYLVVRSVDTTRKVHALLKFADFRLSLDGMEPMEALIEHLSVYAAFIKNPCFVLIGAKQYYETEEIEALYRIAVYKKWRLILLEPIAAARQLEFENICIIDRDLCILRLQ